MISIDPSGCTGTKSRSSVLSSVSCESFVPTVLPAVVTSGSESDCWEVMVVSALFVVSSLLSYSVVFSTFGSSLFSIMGS